MQEMQGKEQKRRSKMQEMRFPLPQAKEQRD